MSDGRFSTVAIIPARGGSKGIPGKNIRLLAGKPLIAYTIEAARACRLIDRTIVSTDDPEIAAVSREWGVEVPFMRPAELAADMTADLPVFRHALTWLEEQEGYEPTIVVHLRPTAPLRRAVDISQAIERLIASGADSVRSVCRAAQHPHKMWTIEDGWLKSYISGDQAIPEAYNMPRQQLPRAFVQNGSVDVAWRRTIFEKHSMTGSRILALEMEPRHSVNIDSEIDFAMAELLVSARSQRP